MDDWSGATYSQGSYIQAKISEQFLSKIKIKPQDQVLDVGCGDGGFSLKIIKTFPMATFLGIDRSENMLAEARNKVVYPFAKFEIGDVTTMQYQNKFDYVVSFWCLHWVNDIKLAFQNIYQALKDGGQCFTLFTYGDDEFIKTIEAVKATGKFPALNQFKLPINFTKLHADMQQLNKIAFKELEVKQLQQAITLPSLEIFANFIKGFPFFEGQIPKNQIPAIYKEMVKCYAENHQDKYKYEYNIYTVSAIK